MKRLWHWRVYLIRAGFIFSAFATVSLLAVNALAADDDDPRSKWGFDPGQVEQWKESPTRLPDPPPATSRLLAVPMGPADTLTLYIDPVSVSRLKDGVARMTLVLESRSGVRNVFFDGLRCETLEYKTYAIGRPDGTWMPIKKPEWRKVLFFPTNAYRHTLMKQYVCSDVSGGARKPDEIIQVIRFPPPPTD